MYTHLWTTVMYFHAKCLTLTAGNRWFPHMKLCYSRSWAQRRQTKSAAAMARLKSLKTAARKSTVTSKDLCKFWIVLAHPTLKQILDFVKTELILI